MTAGLPLLPQQRRRVSLLAALLLGEAHLTASLLVQGSREGEASTAQAWGSLANKANGKPGCPVDYDVPLGNHRGPSPLHLASVNNFVDDVDQWWTEKRVEHYFDPNIDHSYKIAPSPINGCGMRATRLIKAGERVGPVWVPDDNFAFFVHFTPWFGRAINHCPDSDTHLEKLEDGSVWTIASRDIQAGEELTGNYDEAHRQFPKLVQGAEPSWTCSNSS